MARGWAGKVLEGTHLQIVYRAVGATGPVFCAAGLLHWEGRAVPLAVHGNCSDSLQAFGACPHEVQRLWLKPTIAY